MTMPITDARPQPGARLLAVEDEPDAALPGTDGFDVLQRLRAVGRVLRLPAW